MVKNSKFSELFNIHIEFTSKEICYNSVGAAVRLCVTKW